MKKPLAFGILLSTLCIGISLRAGGQVQYQSQDIPPNCGVVEGRVVDAADQPVSGVRVYSMVMGRPPQGRLLSTVTDAEGKFLLKCVEPGRNSIYISKEEEGYPDTAFAPFLNPDLVPVVNVIEQQVVGGIDVHLPPKSGKLSGHILDAQTLRPLVEARLNLCLVDDPNKCYATRTNLDGEFSLRLPSVPFTLKASASGYEDWDYTKVPSPSHKNPNKTVASASLLIRPMDNKDISILLHPLKK